MKRLGMWGQRNCGEHMQLQLEREKATQMWRSATDVKQNSNCLNNKKIGLRSDIFPLVIDTPYQRACEPLPKSAAALCVNEPG